MYKIVAKYSPHDEQFEYRRRYMCFIVFCFWWRKQSERFLGSKSWLCWVTSSDALQTTYMMPYNWRRVSRYKENAWTTIQSLGAYIFAFSVAFNICHKVLYAVTAFGSVLWGSLIPTFGRLCGLQIKLGRKLYPMFTSPMQ